MKSSKSVSGFIINHPNWQSELKVLHNILLDTEMAETIKWGIPVYTINGKNVLGIGAFKTYVGIWFYQGVFLSDPSKVLVNAQEGKTKGMRQWRFISIKDIDSNLIMSYIQEAIANQKDGMEVKPEKKPLIIPELLESILDDNDAFSKCFNLMTLTLKREYVEYVEYISEAKKETTKLTKLEKIKPMILAGKGLNDKYR